MLWKFVYYRIGSKQETEDIVSESFIAIFQ
ncbi:MAG: hypothetical protein H6765_08810 [Candidatus Peribacteria bacterium]|nr:MAG: hypothetical protein H6765_08810 [Candidatus Peribacteria bacterium]